MITFKKFLEAKACCSNCEKGDTDLCLKPSKKKSEIKGGLNKNQAAILGMIGFPKQGQSQKQAILNQIGRK